jgi:hypothetical protein
MPYKAGPWQLNELKSRLRREQEERERVASDRCRQAEKKDKDRRQRKVKFVQLHIVFVGRVLSSLILDCCTLGNCCVERQKHTDLDMKKGAWQSRGRTCKLVASPEGIVLFINNRILFWSRVRRTSKRLHGPLKSSLDTSRSHGVR